MLVHHGNPVRWHRLTNDASHHPWVKNDPWMTWKFYQNDRNGPKWSVLLKIQKSIWNSTGTPAFRAASGLFETNRDVLAFSFQKLKKILWFKKSTPWATEVGWKPDPRGSEIVRISGGRPGDGQPWYGLIHYLKMKKMSQNVEWYLGEKCFIIYLLSTFCKISLFFTFWPVRTILSILGHFEIFLIF